MSTGRVPPTLKWAWHHGERGCGQQCHAGLLPVELCPDSCFRDAALANTQNHHYLLLATTHTPHSQTYVYHTASSCFSLLLHKLGDCLKHLIYMTRVYWGQEHIILSTHDRLSQVFVTTVEPPIKDPPRKGRPPYKGHSILQVPLP